MKPAAWVNGSHPFVETLHAWEQGVPVDCGAAWSSETIDLAIAKGPHRSALLPESIALVHDDVAYQVKAGFARIVSWDELRLNMPQHLKISPLAVIPQLNRRGRMILDLSFAVHRKALSRKRRLGEIVQACVNDTTVPLAPSVPVKELGNVLPRLLDFMAEVPVDETILFSKIDLSDGFWRMVVSDEDSYNFAYVLPDVEGAPIRLVIPQCLQMGWTESPALFCAATETARDVIQSLIDTKECLPDHPMEPYFEPKIPAPRQSHTAQSQWQMSAVFVDDFILAVVENAEGTLVQQTTRAALHGIHGFFPPTAVSGHMGGKDPISEKKLEKGDARWAPTKEILGYLVDGSTRTIRLPAEKANRIISELKQILKKVRVPVTRYQSLVGKLRHAANILPAIQSLFTPLNNALKNDPSFIGLGKDSEVRAALRDFITLIQDLEHRPTHVSELVARPDSYIGFVDASAAGAGGVWFGGDDELDPTVWHFEFPPDITQDVVSDANPNGRLTNSDLEMAGVVLEQAVLLATTNMRRKRSVINCDNTPSVSWVHRMASRASSNVSHRLLRGMAMLQRATESAPPELVSVAGDDNDMADIASRIMKYWQPDTPAIFAQGAPNDEQFLTFYNARFPLPQNTSWTIVHPDPVTLSNVISTLRGQRLPMQQWMPPLVSHNGGGGLNTRPNAASTHGYGTVPGFESSKLSWPLPPGFELDFLGTRGKLVAKRSRKRYVPWRKPLCWLGTTTHGDPMVARNSTCPSATS